MSEDDHLALLRFQCQPLRHLPAATVIERGDRIVKHNAAAALAELHLGKEGGNCYRVLLALAEDCRW